MYTVIMKNMFMIILISLASMTLTAAGYAGSEVQSIYSSDAFITFYDEIYNGLPIKKILEHSQELKDLISSGDHSHQAKQISIARIELNIGRQYIMEEYCRDLTEAEKHLEKGLETLAELEGGSSSVEFLLVKGELYGAYFLLDEKANLFSYGMKANSITQELWKRDKDNPRTIILKANQLIYTPKLFGGSLSSAKRLLKSLEDVQLLPWDSFTVYSCLGIIEAKQKDKRTADSYYLKAKSIYPNNNYIKQLRSELQ